MKNTAPFSIPADPIDRHEVRWWETTFLTRADAPIARPIILDRSQDHATALAREVRRVFPVLEASLDVERNLIEQVTAPLRSMLASMLDDVPEEPVVEQEGNVFRVSKSHWAARAQVESLAKSVGPAPNFVQMALTTPDGDFIVTVQRPGGKDPATLVAELRARIAALEGRCRENRAPVQDVPLASRLIPRTPSIPNTGHVDGRNQHHALNEPSSIL